MIPMTLQKIGIYIHYFFLPKKFKLENILFPLKNFKTESNYVQRSENEKRRSTDTWETQPTLQTVWKISRHFRRTAGNYMYFLVWTIVYFFLFAYLEFLREYTSGMRVYSLFCPSLREFIILSHHSGVGKMVNGRVTHRNGSTEFFKFCALALLSFLHPINCPESK